MTTSKSRTQIVTLLIGQRNGGFLIPFIIGSLWQGATPGHPQPYSSLCVEFSSKRRTWVCGKTTERLWTNRPVCLWDSVPRRAEYLRTHPEGFSTHRTAALCPLHLVLTVLGEEMEMVEVGVAGWGHHLSGLMLYTGGTLEWVKGLLRGLKGSKRELASEALIFLRT